MNEYFNVYFDEKGILHVSPRNNIESMALKHLKQNISEGSMEDFVSIDTEVSIKLPAA